MDGEKKKRRTKKDSEVNPSESLGNLEPKLIKIQPEIPFSVWFNRKLKLGKVKFWQEEALAVFMRKNGLSESETEDSYNEVLKRF